MPGDRDGTIIVTVKRWAVRGENMPRIALHVHGDQAAFGVTDKIVDAFRGLAEDALTGPHLSLSELDEEVRRIAQRLGLDGYAGECKCTSDPLATIIDASLYRRASGRGSTQSEETASD